MSLTCRGRADSKQGCCYEESETASPWGEAKCDEELSELVHQAADPCFNRLGHCDEPRSSRGLSGSDDLALPTSMMRLTRESGAVTRAHTQSPSMMPIMTDLFAPSRNRAARSPGGSSSLTGGVATNRARTN